MIIILKKQATKEDADKLLEIIEKQGLKPLYLPGSERTVLGALGDERVLAGLQLDSHPFVDRVVPILSPYKMASRDLRASDTVVRVGSVGIGPGRFAIMAGPCAVESEAQILEAARAVKAAGGHILRGGAFKPRTSPYAFQGLELEGLKLLKLASEETGLPVVSEIIDRHDVDLMRDYVDMFQVGARNMQNFRLLRELGRAGKPVLLKRGMSATYNDFLMSAEYILSEGNPDVVLCERGIKTFVTDTRNTLDLNLIPWARQRTHLPIIVDPSHGTGVRDLVLPMAKAAAACGADGVMIEVHPRPDEALSDGPQSLFPDQFARLVKQVGRYAELEGRRLT